MMQALLARRRAVRETLAALREELATLERQIEAGCEHVWIVDDEERDHRTRYVCQTCRRAR